MKEYEIVVPLGLCFEPLNLRGVCVHAVMVEIDLSHVVRVSYRRAAQPARA